MTCFIRLASRPATFAIIDAVLMFLSLGSMKRQKESPASMLHKTNTRIQRRATLGLFAAAAFATLFTAPAALAGEQDFTLVNKTGVEIHNLHIAPHSSDEWGSDILGKDTMSDGETLDITFHRSEKAAHWDLSISDEKGNSITWENLNLLEISKVTLHYKDGKAWADLE